MAGPGLEHAMIVLPTETRRMAGFGIVLVILGTLFLLGQQSAIQVDWPIWPIAIGVGLFVAGLLVGGEGGVGFAIAGGIVTMVGVVLGVQRWTDGSLHWAYAWALVAPGGVGLGMTAYGLLTGQWRHVRVGLGAMVAGLAIVLIGFMFLEGPIGLGEAEDEVVSVIAPAAIVGLGVLLLIGAVVAPHMPNDEMPSEGWATVPAGVGGSPNDTEPPSVTKPPSDSERRSIELGDATEGEVSLVFGAGRLDVVGPAAQGHLVDGTFHGGARLETSGPGRVKLTTPADRAWDLAPFRWRMGLSAEVPIRLSIESGAAQTTADLSSLRLTDLRIRTGASETRIRLPREAGTTRVDAEAGAASLVFEVPHGVAARIRSRMGLGATDIDTTRFPRDPSGSWTSPDWATAANRVEFDLRGGIGSVTVR
jgi:hypothetical protein